MGKGSDPVKIGQWYRVAFHHGISATPIDAFLEFRGGDKTAWSGELTASGRILINKLNLWGGETDQGGILGSVDVMFGEADQQPNAYLQKVFGSQQPAWRGMTTLVFRGGKYGAMNPYPQSPSYKFRTIKKGWDNDTCWYPEKAQIDVLAGNIDYHGDGWDYQIEHFSEPNTVWSDFTIPTTGWISGGQMPFTTNGMSGGSYWTPTRSNLWVRRTVTANVSGLVLHIGADNGCVVFVDGVQVGGSNTANDPIPSNNNNPVDVPLTVGTTFELVIKAFAEISASDEAGNILQISLSGAKAGAMNPAHILYDGLTAADRGAEPIDIVNDANWRAGADWFYDQGIGFCTAFDPDAETVEQFIVRMQTVANCSVTKSPTNGQWYLDIANGVYVLDDLPILNDDDILEFSDKPTVLDDMINSLAVEYFDVNTKAIATTPPIQALALVTTNGLHHTVKQYHEIPAGPLAARICQRDLQSLITPTRVFTMTTTRKPYSWRRSTYFRLQAPKRGITDLVCTLAQKSSGTLKSGAMSITAVPDTRSMPTAIFNPVVERGVDTRRDQTPKAITQQLAWEAPYINVVRAMSAANLATVPADAGYLLTLAADPGDTRDYTIQVSVDGGSTYDGAMLAPWCPTANIIEGDSLADAAPATDFTLSDEVDLDNVDVGSAALWGNEIVRVDAVDPDADPPTLTLARGCADTVPAVHAANARIWFYGLYYAGSDRVQYAAGETIDVKLLDNTGTDQLVVDDASAMSLEFAGRWSLPYPPAQVKIAGDWYPSTASGSVTVTWAPRNAQTQADMLVDTTAAGVTAPETIRYGMRLLDASDTELVARDDIDGNTADFVLDYTGDATLELWSITDAGESLQRHSITFAYTPPGGSVTSAITGDAYAGIKKTVIHDGGQASS